MGISALERMAANMGLLGAFIALVVMVVAAAFLLGLIFRIVIGYFPNIPRAIGVVLLTAGVAFATSIVGRLFSAAACCCGWLSRQAAWQSRPSTRSLSSSQSYGDAVLSVGAGLVAQPLA